MHVSKSYTYVTHQVLEIDRIVFKVIEINRQKSTCPVTLNSIIASNPPGVFDNDCFGPKLKSFILMLHFDYMMSYSRISKFIYDVSGFKINKSQLINLTKKCKRHLNPTYEDLSQNIRNSKVVGIDETGWRVDGKNFWMWVFQNDSDVLYAIEPHRSSEIPRSILKDDYGGIIVSDYYSAYNKVNSFGKQKCLAHLLRDLQYNYEVTGEKDGSFSDRMIKLIHRGIHLKNSTEFNSDSYILEKIRINDDFNILLSSDVSNDLDKRMLKRLVKYKSDTFRFLNYSYVPPTNNSSERAIRGRVIHRKICNGSKSLDGKDCYSVISSIIETFKKRGVNVYNSLIDLFENLPSSPQLT